MSSGSEVESYLRALQSLGVVAPHPWSIRSFAPQGAAALLPRTSDHPWADRFGAAGDSAGGAALRAGLDLHTFYNTGFPTTQRSQVRWIGRGATAAAVPTLAVRHGAFSIVLAPSVAFAENRSFALAPNGYEGDAAYGARWFPEFIDLPQRFGEDRSLSIEPGNSSVAVDLAGASLGFSTAAQHWGPAEQSPIVLSGDAPGFPHVFLGSTRPVDIRVGALHARAIWGRLEQTRYSMVPADSARRLAAGYALAFQPAFLTGLEIGVNRFFHFPWTPGSFPWRSAAEPFQTFWARSLYEDADESVSLAENQLASVFARWVFAPAGFEVFGEYGREDHSWDLRDFLLEPDNQRAYVLGFHKVWTSGPTRVVRLRGEVANAQASPVKQIRTQAPFYLHSTQRQGHTHRGRLLGSETILGGAGSVVGVDWFARAGSYTVEWTRLANDHGLRVLPVEMDVSHGLGLRATRFGAGRDYRLGMVATRNYNRNHAGDAFNLHLSAAVLLRFR